MASIVDLFSSLTEEEEYYKSLFEKGEDDDVSLIRLPGPVETDARKKARITLSSSFYLKSPEDQVKILKHPVFMPRYLHSHDFVEMTYAYRGSVEESVEGKDIKLDEGEMLVLTPGIFHTVSVKDEKTIALNLIVSSSLFLDTERVLDGRLTNKRYIHLSLPSGIEEELSLLLDEQEREDSMSKKVSSSIFLILMAKIERSRVIMEEADADENEASAYRALSYIDKNYRTVTISSFSEAFGMSERSASRLFKERFNSSFTAIVKKKRMEEALYLLQHSTLSCKEIAYLVGYTSQEHFSRLFHSYYGVSAESVKKERL